MQRARTEAGDTVAQTMIDQVGAVNARAAPFGSVGVVIGATAGRDRASI